MPGLDIVFSVRNTSPFAEENPYRQAATELAKILVHTYDILIFFKNINFTERLVAN